MRLPRLFCGVGYFDTVPISHDGKFDCSSVGKELLVSGLHLAVLVVVIRNPRPGVVPSVPTLRRGFVVSPRPLPPENQS